MSLKPKYLVYGGIALLALLLAFFVVNNNSLANPLSADGSINTNLVQQHVDSGQAVLLDVRTQVEYDLDHAVNAENFNVEKLKVGEFPDIDKNQRVYVYCRSGNRSAQAAAIMIDDGYQDVIDLGGIGAWVESGGELEQSQLDDYLTQLKNLGEEPIAAQGPDNAELTLVKFSDFACPFCARYTIETEPQIIENYVNNPAKSVRYEFRNFTYLGDESALAAMGGYCANEQSLFWSYHNVATVGFAQVGDEFYTVDNLAEVITQIKGNAEEFKECLISEKYASVISAETIDARDSGITGTPTVIVGDQTIDGARPYQAYALAIDQQLD